MWITKYLFAVEKVSKEKIEQMKATIENLKQTIDVLRNYASQQITDATRFRYFDWFIVLAIIAILLLFLRIKYPGKEKIINNKLKKQGQDEFWDENTHSADKFMIFDKVVVKTDRDILTSRLPIPKFKQCEYKFKVIKYGNNYNTIRFGVIPKNTKDTGSEKKEEYIIYYSNPTKKNGYIMAYNFEQFQEQSNLFIKEGDYLIINVNLISKKVVFKHIEQTSLQQKHSKSVQQWSVPIYLTNRQLFIFASLTNQSIIELVSISEKS